MNWYGTTNPTLIFKRAAVCATLALALIFGAPVGAAGEWQLDTARSSVGFLAESRLGDVPGVFHKWQIDAKVPADLSKGSGRFVVNVASIDTQNKRRDDHLRNPDFFEVEKYPEAVFTIGSVSTEGDTVLVNGKMRIKDVERSETIRFRKTESEDRLELKGRLVVDRTQYGITYDSIFNPIENEVLLQLNLVFKR